MAHKIGQYEKNWEKKLEKEGSFSATSSSSSLTSSAALSDSRSQNSGRSRKDAACWVYIYQIIHEGDDDTHEDQIKIEKEETYISPISHRSTIKISESLLDNHKINYGADDDLRETKLKIMIKSAIRKVTLVADVGGLSLRIFLVNLEADVTLERQDLLEVMELDSAGKVASVTQQGHPRYYPTTTRLSLDSKLKSVIIDFIEAKNQTNTVLKLEVEESKFEAKPNHLDASKVLRLEATIGLTKVSLPLTASKIQSVLTRATNTIGEQFQDFNQIFRPQSSSNLDTADIIPTTNIPKYENNGVFIDERLRSVDDTIETPGTARLQASNSIGTPGRASSEASRTSIIPLVFEVTLKGMNLTTKLLDSITAEYNMRAITGKILT